MASTGRVAAANPSISTQAPGSFGPGAATAPSAPSVTPTVTASTGASMHAHPPPAPHTPPRSQDYPLREMLQYGHKIDQLANASDPHSLESHESHDGVKNLMKQQQNHLTYVRHLCTMVRMKQLREHDVDHFCRLLEQQHLLEEHIKQLEGELAELQWKALSSQASMSVSEDAVADILITVKEGATTIGTLSAFGAGLALSLLYSANRGKLNYIYAGFWSFYICMAAVAALGMASTVKTTKDLKATRYNWVARRLMLFAVVVTFFGTVGGFVCLALGVVNFDVSDEMQDAGREPRIQDGPRPGPNVPRTPTGAIAYALIFMCALVMLFTFIWRIRPRARLFDRGLRRLRTKEYLEYGQV